MDFITDQKTKLTFGDLNDPEQIKGLFLWVTGCETEAQDVLREFAGMFVTLRNEIKGSEMNGIDFCDRALDSLFSLTLERDEHSRDWVNGIADAADVDLPYPPDGEPMVEETDELAQKISDVLTDKSLPEPLYNHFKTALTDFFNHNVDTEEIENAENSRHYIRMLLRGHKTKADEFLRSHHDELREALAE